MKKTKYVDPLIGTVGDVKTASIHGGGKTHPGATFPFGMVQLSSDTTTSGDNGTGYNYCHNTIEGFSFNHMSGVGWYGDLGNLQIMPIVGETDLRSGSNAEVPFTKGSVGWKSHFSHENEVARAGYYSVFLDRYGILAEATVSEHAGQLRFTYPANDESGMILNFSRRIAGRSNCQTVEIDGNYIHGCITCDHEYGGFGRGRGKIDYRLWFCLEVSKPIIDARFFENEELCDSGIKKICGDDLHLLLRFPTNDGERVLIRCGISYTDAEGAKRNLETECPEFNFDGMYEAADVDGATKAQQFWKITLPLLLVTLGPMLVGSFAFAFNNFGGIFLLTGGGPVMDPGVLPGQTDILISYTYKLAFGANETDYGLASAIGIIVFFIIGTITFLQFKYTGAFKEVDNA